MAKDDDLEAQLRIEKGLVAGKTEGHMLEEVLMIYPSMTRPRVKMLLDGVVPGRTPENPIRFVVDPTPRRRSSPHLDRVPALISHSAALVAAGKPPSLKTSGPAKLDTDHMVFCQGRRNLLKVRKPCGGKSKFICVTHGAIFTTAEELADHCRDLDQHDTTSTEFEPSREGHGHVTARWCEHIGKEMVQHWMGHVEPIWLQHALEVLDE